MRERLAARLRLVREGLARHVGHALAAAVQLALHGADRLAVPLRGRRRGGAAHMLVHAAVVALRGGPVLRIASAGGLRQARDPVREPKCVPNGRFTCRYGL